MNYSTYNFPIYRPPSKFVPFDGFWKDGLGMFKNKGSDFPGVYYQDEHTVTIYDQYPKSIVHLLVLPQKNILNLDSLGPQDVPILLEMKKTKDLIIQHLSGPQEPKSKLNLEYKSGFHAIPSMNHLHLHIISNDFLLVKNAKHYQSFNSSYLVPDLHPGKDCPIGAACASTDVFYPHLIGNDIGCGMSFYKTTIKSKRLKLES
uniref:3'-phosphate/5'-hydroxy nucleic acid ligase n=1 Tax=Arcella intermedia TaxID=1963864 RepID=A0A6B2LIM6_9EUKA